MTIVKPFALGRHAVTFQEYEAFCAATKREPPGDEGWGRKNRPVINVSREDVRVYCAWLSEQTGRPNRLPTEAEWEYACRAGTETARYRGDAAGEGHANFDGSGTDWSGRRTAPVGSFEPGPWRRR